MKNLGLYNENLDIPRKQDIDEVNAKVNDVNNKIDGHIANKLNPHGVTASQIGALPMQNGAAGQLLGFTANNVVGPVNPPSGGLYTKTLAGTLTTAWSGASAPFYQQIAVTGMTSTVCPLVFPQWSANPPSVAEKQAWNTIEGTVESFDGFVRFYTNTKTTTAVNFILYY